MPLALDETIYVLHYSNLEPYEWGGEIRSPHSRRFLIIKILKIVVCNCEHTELELEVEMSQC